MSWYAWVAGEEVKSDMTWWGWTLIGIAGAIVLVVMVFIVAPLLTLVAAAVDFFFRLGRSR